MNGSLVALIVLIILIIIIVIAANPDSRNAVANMLGKKKELDVLEPVEASKKPSQKVPVKNIPAKPVQASHPNVQDLFAKKYAETKQNREAYIAAQKAAMQPKPQAAPQQPPRAKPTHQVQVERKHEYVPIVEGSVENMFDAKLDVQSEFGLTEAQLDQMAKEHYERHLAESKASKTRHRSLRHSELDKAEIKLQNSMMQVHRNDNDRIDVDDFTFEALGQNIMAAEKNKAATKRSSRNKVFVVK